MGLLTILEYPDPRLRIKANLVQTIDASIHRIVDDMFETMYSQKGVGLAATQVNIALRIVVMDIGEEKQEPLCLINPEIIARAGLQYESEGCLSFPGLFDKVERAASVQMRALNREGTPFEIKGEGLLAICIQHEIDHLDGILFADHFSRLKQERIRKKTQKIRRHVT